LGFYIAVCPKYNVNIHYRNSLISGGLYMQLNIYLYLTLLPKCKSLHFGRYTLLAINILGIMKPRGENMPDEYNKSGHTAYDINTTLYG
jgi:hypothetical protein